MDTSRLGRWYAVYNDGGPEVDGLVDTGRVDPPSHFACRELGEAGIHYMGPYRTREHVDEVVSSLNASLEDAKTVTG